MDGVNNAWKDSCRVLLGDEAGDLVTYENYLRKYTEPVFGKVSSISGKNVAVSPDFYLPGAKFIANEEVGEYERQQKALGSRIDFNSLKDLDSLVESVREKAYYCGDVVLGNSKDIELSNRCVNSSFVYKSQEVYDSKYVAYSNSIRYGEYIFGSSYPGETKFCIKGFEVIKATRCLEVVAAHNSFDCAYTGNLDYCTNCMFSFNLRNKNFFIGNNQLSKDTYTKLSEKLREDMLETLKTRKMLPSILDLVSASASEDKRKQPRPSADNASRVSVPPEAELAFQKVTGVVLGAPLKGLEKFSNWLKKYDDFVVASASALSGVPVYAPPVSFYKVFKHNFITFQEAFDHIKPVLDARYLEQPSFSAIQEKLVPLYITPEAVIGDNKNVQMAGAYGYSLNCFYGAFFNQSKNCAYCFWPRQSEYMFGSTQVFSSAFCIKCYNSANLTRCFEVSNSNNCSDCFFCHNCENLSDSMFCFNAKNLRNAVGNVELEKEEYAKIKSMFLTQVLKKIEETNRLDYSIYNIGDGKTTAVI